MEKELPTMSTSSPSKRSPKPKYRLQREKNRPDRAYVWVNGKKVNLGTFGSQESWDRYNELIGKTKRIEPAAPAEPAPPTVAMLMAGYLEHAERYYRRPDGKPGREYQLAKEVFRHVRKHCSDLPAKDFGPRRLKAVRQDLVDTGHSRKFINKNIDRIRRMFLWAVGEEMIPPSIHEALKAVPGLKQGRTEAPDLPPIQPVADDVIEATLPFLPDVIADMVRIQRLTGMRGGEVVQLRPCDLDRSADVWVFRPATHKTQYRGRERVVFIGPKGQEILLRYLVRDPQTYCFRPVDSEEKRLAELHRNRKTPLSCGNRPGTNRVENRKKQPGEAYTSNSYRRAIHRACDKAFPAPKSLKGKALAEWQSSRRWCPHQLRHAAATEVRKNFGLEAAQIVLGHSAADVTQIYAERDLAKGLEVAKLIG
jgi:integrase